MRRVIGFWKFFVNGLAVAVIAMSLAGCVNSGTKTDSEHPGTEHPTTEHPSSEHPK